METVGLERAAAARLLDAADGHVKTAIVMGCNDLGREEAARRLEETGGRVGRLVEGCGGG